MITTERGRHRADRHGLGRRFSILWVGQIVSQFGDYLAYFSIPLFVLFLTGDDFALALNYTIEAVPAVVVGFLGGLVIDRLPIRFTLIVSDLVRAAAFAYLAWFASTGPVQGDGGGIFETQVLLVFAVAFIAGTFLNLFAGALYVLITQLVRPDQLAEANGRIGAVQNLAFALGPVVAGVLVSATGEFTLVFTVNSLSFFLSAVSIALLGPVKRRRSPEDSDEDEGLMADVFNGLRYLWSEPRLRTSTIAIAIANLSVGFLESTLLLTADQVIFATEDWEKGVLFAALGLGAAFGAYVAPGFIRWLGLGRTMIAGLFTLGLGFAIFVSMRFGPVLLIYVFVAFIGLQLVNVPLVTIRQTFTPEVMLGRVLTASRAIGWAPTPIGALLGVGIAELLAELEMGGFESVVRVSPFLILLVGLGLIPTIIWRDTFGPVYDKDHPASAIAPTPLD